MLDLELVTPPATPALSLAEAKRHLRVDHEDENEDITDAIQAAIGHLDGYAGILGRAIVAQTWALSLDGFPAGQIVLPLPPLIAVESLTYVATTGVPVVLDPSAYKVLAGERSAVAPTHGRAWPQARREPRSVTVVFRCGWEAPTGEAIWPSKVATIRSALKLMVGDLYKHRQTSSEGAISSQIMMSTRVQDLLAPIKLPRF